jgi:hypothetical protein
MVAGGGDQRSGKENLHEPVANQGKPAEAWWSGGVRPFVAPRQGNAFSLKYKYPCHLLGYWENFDEE